MWEEKKIVKRARDLSTFAQEGQKYHLQKRKREIRFSDCSMSKGYSHFFNNTVMVTSFYLFYDVMVVGSLNIMVPAYKNAKIGAWLAWPPNLL
jgi:hypothetical protein